VVARSGEPHVHTLWVAPEKDPEFSRARKADRVMTVQRGSGTTDFGTVGFEAGHAGEKQYLVFPKTLKRFAGARVVGIKFDLVTQPKAVPAKAEQIGRAPKRRRGKPPAGRSTGAMRARVIPFDRPKRDEEPSHTAPSPARPNAPARATDLHAEIRAAMKELKAGKSVAAYQRLERALKEK
jgi:hypothetical protein